MHGLATLLPNAKSLSRADKLRLIQLLAQDLADADRAVLSPAVSPTARPPRLPSPRLARPEQAADFVKQVREADPDAAV